MMVVCQHDPRMVLNFLCSRFGGHMHVIHQSFCEQKIGLSALNIALIHKRVCIMYLCCFSGHLDWFQISVPLDLIMLFVSLKQSVYYCWYKMVYFHPAQVRNETLHYDFPCIWFMSGHRKLFKQWNCNSKIELLDYEENLKNWGAVIR